MGGGRVGTHLLLALTSWPSTTHPSQDTPPFLLLIEIPPIFRCSLRFLHTLQHTEGGRAGGGGVQSGRGRGVASNIISRKGFVNVL